MLMGDEIGNIDSDRSQELSASLSDKGLKSAQSQERTEEERTSRRKRVADYLKTAFITLVVALFLKTFVVEAFRIPSGSMENTLLVGDFLLVNKIVYGLRTPRYVPLTNVAIPPISLPSFNHVERGDVVVFEFPAEREQVSTAESVNYIKRCIGLPGDTVEILSGRVFVNGKELTLPNHAKASVGVSHPHWQSGYRMFPPGSGFTEGHYGPLIVPQKGDAIQLTATNVGQWKALIAREGHRAHLASHGAILIDDRETTQYVIGQDYYFVMGDNRENSLDSRYWGFVPEDHLIGEALVVYWSWNPDVIVPNFVDKFKSVRWERVGMLIH